MNKDRILIDGVWYVREQNIPINIEVTRAKSITTENHKYCFEATKIEREDGTYYDGFDIEFVDKRPPGGKANWKTEYWDHMGFFKGCLDRNDESLTELRKYVCEDGVEEFIAFLKVLDKEGWFLTEYPLIY